jgi:secreted trypsin-like serine protease
MAHTYNIAPPGWQPVKMNLDSNVPSLTKEPLIIMGYGSSTDGTISAPYNDGDQLQLREAPTDYMAFNDCAVASNPDTGVVFGEMLQDGTFNTVVMDDWFCTLKTNPRTATCIGDSGGPIILEGATPDEDLLVASISGNA